MESEDVFVPLPSRLRSDRISLLILCSSPRSIFDKVPIVSPNGDVLIKEMSFKIERGVRPSYSLPIVTEAKVITYVDGTCSVTFLS